MIAPLNRGVGKIGNNIDEYRLENILVVFRSEEPSGDGIVTFCNYPIDGFLEIFSRAFFSAFVGLWMNAREMPWDANVGSTCDISCNGYWDGPPLGLCDGLSYGCNDGNPDGVRDGTLDGGTLDALSLGLLDGR